MNKINNRTKHIMSTYGKDVITEDLKDTDENNNTFEKKKNAKRKLFSEDIQNENQINGVTEIITAEVNKSTGYLEEMCIEFGLPNILASGNPESSFSNELAQVSTLETTKDQAEITSSSFSNELTQASSLEIAKHLNQPEAAVCSFSNQASSVKILVTKNQTPYLANHEMPSASSVNTQGWFEDLTKLVVPTVTKKKKMDFCIFCHKQITNFARHVMTVHKDEAKVKRCIELPKGSVDRSTILADIRKDGNYLHNTDVRYNTTSYNVCRRPNDTRNADDFLACPNCKGFYASKSLRFHVKRCAGNEAKKIIRDATVAGKVVTGRIHSSACAVLKNIIFPPLRITDGVRAIRYDKYVMKYANLLCRKYKAQQHYKMIRSELRNLGKLMLEVRSRDPDISDLISCLDPSKYDTVISSIQAVGKYDESTGIYAAPTNSTMLGTTIKKCCDLFIFECIKNKNELLKSTIENFKILLVNDLNVSISRGALESLTLIKRQKKATLPETDSIKILSEYSMNEMKKWYDKLIMEYDYYSWKRLGTACLVYLFILNRRRAGELERMMLTDFTNFETLDVNVITDKDINFQIGSRYRRITLKGKLGRTVPVYIPLYVYTCMQLFIDTRSVAEVPTNNPFVFGIPGRGLAYNFLSACVYIREYSNRSGVKDPQLISGTNLRKHIATTSKTNKLDAALVSDLANHMGHNELIHRNIYRLPVPSHELMVVPDILERASGNPESSFSNELAQVSTLETTKDQAEITSSSFSNELTQASSLEIAKHLNQPEAAVCSFSNQASSVEILVTKNQTPYLANHDEMYEMSSASSVNPLMKTPHKINKKKKDVNYSPTLSEVTSGSDFSPLRQEGSKVIRTPIKRKPWTTPEKNTTRSVFSANYSSGSLPSYAECRTAILQNHILKNRTIAQLKAFINNEIKNNMFNDKLNIKKSSKRHKIPWSTPERSVARELFRSNVENNVQPDLFSCEQAIKNNPCLHRRNAASLKAWVIQKMKKND